MSHSDSGHYALKHRHREILPDVSSAIQARSVNGRIPCADLHALARSFNMPPEEMGVQADLIEIRLCRCILGLFGYEAEKQHTKKILDPEPLMAPDLIRALREDAPEGKMSCSRCWKTAARLGIRRLHAASVCEKLGIKIKPCQLGAF